MKKIFHAVVLSSSLVLVLVLAFGCAQTKSEVVSKEFDSGIKGQVFYTNQGAAEGVFVYAYDSPYNDLRVPTKYISAPTAEDGSYTLKLPPGSYYIVARKRTTGDPRGYLVKGDYEGKYPSNPVTVTPGTYAAVKISIEQLMGAFLAAPYLPDEGNMGISGKVYDDKGKPVPGAYVMLYTDKEMVGMPALLSKPTGKDGGYTVFLQKPGTYYVAARIKFGGLPRKSEPYGMYDKDPDHKVTLGDKEVVTGVDVMLTPFPFDLAKPIK